MASPYGTITARNTPALDHPHFRNDRETPSSVLEFHETYNTTWLVERHGFVRPAAFRQCQLQSAANAA